MFDLVLVDRENKQHILKYDPKDNSVINADDGSSIFEDNVRIKYPIAKAVSKDNPGRKGNIKRLKISMGLKCNYSCQYCSQSSFIGTETDTNNEDAKVFLSNLDKWIRGTPNKIEFWGGEPFVYWSKLKILVPALKDKFPEAKMSIITNGSLLNKDKIEFIEKYDIMIAISHDGPNQKFRGPDPFNDPKIFASIYNLFKLRPEKVSFNSVLHAKNYDLEAIWNWFNEKIPNSSVNLEGIVNTYDSFTLGYLGRFTKAQLMEMSDNVFREIVNGKNRFPDLTNTALRFIESLRTHREMLSLGQKCGMDREDSISVDLEGNVSTCQNTGLGDHQIGHVDDYKNIALTTATHFSLREECNSCPVVQLCKGSCMFLNDDFFAQSCWNEYYYNIGILRAALYMLTGALLVSINGDILRPEFSEEHMKKYPSLAELYS